MKFILSLSLKVKIIIAVCAVAAASVVGTVIILNSEEAYRVIKVFELNGSATVTRENTGDISAYAGMNLESGDVLSVDKNSTLRISLDSDKYILLDGGTILELIAQGTEADSKTVINLQEGTILNEIKNSLSANSSYEVNTPKATMAVRGTIFSVTTHENPDGSFVTDLYTTEGTVSVQLFDESGNPKGAETYVSKGGAVTILTEVNNETGNSADVDGDPHFVFRNDDGGLIDCGYSDPVYFPGNEAYAEAQTEQTAASVLTDTEVRETSSAVSATESTVTAVSVYEAVLPVSDVPTVTTVLPESSEHKPVFPSEIESSAETSAAITTTVPETTVTSVPQTKKTEQTTAATPEKTTATVTSATSAATETRPFYPVTTPPIYTYPPIITSAPIKTSPAISSETSPAESSETDSETSEAPTETSPDISSETSEAPTVHRVSFISENGSIISEAEFDENETLGTLPQISDKKGYTGKWVSGGAEVTEDTVISGDMEITAEYTPRPVTVQIIAPHSNDPFNTYGVVLSFTVLYDSALKDNSEGYDIASLTEYVENLYADYFAEHGNVSELKNITFNGPDGNSVLASDASAIAGDCVYSDSDKLYTDISFNYQRSDGA